MWRDVKSCISIYLATHLIIYVSIYLTIELATDFSLYLDTNLQSPACIWIEDWRLKIPQKLLPQIFNPPGGLTIRRKNPVESSFWRGKGFHLSTHSIPSVRPSILSIYPHCPSIHPSFPFIYISTYLSVHLSIYLSTNLSSSIFRSIHLIILSYNVAILGLHVDWRFKKEQSSVQRRYRGYRQQEALRSLQTDYKAKLHRFWHLLMQIAWPLSFSNFHNAANGHILLNAPDLFRPLKLSRREVTWCWPRGLVGKCLGCCRLLMHGGTQTVRFWGYNMSTGGVKAHVAASCGCKAGWFEMFPRLCKVDRGCAAAWQVGFRWLSRP